MKLEKNAKEDERRPIARHLKYRERRAKKTKYVRIRGHEIKLSKTTRWIKEQVSPSPLSSPSRTFCPPFSSCDFSLLIFAALPSYISVLTGSPSGSPATLPHTFSPNQQAKARPFSPMDGFDGAIQRLFACADDESVKFQDARPILNALQLILGCERQHPPPKHHELWDAVTEDHITLFRNPPINIAQKIAIHREWNSEC